MRPYLESPEVQQMAIEPSAPRSRWAICHGVLVAARAIDPSRVGSVLHGRRTHRAHLGPGTQGLGIARSSRFWDANYYRTYMEEPGQRPGFMSCSKR